MSDLRSLVLYNDREDRVHPMEEHELYYEWWYSDFIFDNGWSAVAVFHYRDWLKHSRVPSVEISIYDPEGNRYYEETIVKKDEVKASEEKCDVTIGGHHFWQEDADHYRVVVNSKKVGADLTLKRIAPPMFLPPEGCIYSVGSEQHFCCWPIPRGEASGKIVIDSKEMPVKGICYHDHDWGTTDMNQNFGGWIWGRFFDNVYSGIFCILWPLSEVTPLQKAGTDQAAFIYLAKGKDLILMSESVEMVTLADGFDEPTGQTNPMKFTLKAKEANCEINATFDVQKIVERDHLKFSHWKTHNWRYLDNYEAKITLDGVTDIAKGQMLHERFLLRLK